MNNNAWHHSRVPRRWHFAQNVFRAVENGREVVVASNMGINGVIDAYGGMRTESDEPGCVIAYVNRTERATPSTVYSIVGDSMVVGLSVTLILIVAVALGLKIMKDASARTR
jgi:apolipoprotein N-acyltransferase